MLRVDDTVYVYTNIIIHCQALWILQMCWNLYQQQAIRSLKYVDSYLTKVSTH